MNDKKREILCHMPIYILHDIYLEDGELSVRNYKKYNKGFFIVMKGRYYETDKYNGVLYLMFHYNFYGGL